MAYDLITQQQTPFNYSRGGEGPIPGIIKVFSVAIPVLGIVVMVKNVVSSGLREKEIRKYKALQEPGLDTTQETPAISMDEIISRGL